MSFTNDFRRFGPALLHKGGRVHFECLQVIEQFFWNEWNFISADRAPA